MDEEDNALEKIPESDEFRETDEIDETSKQNIEDIKSQNDEPAAEQIEKESELIKHEEESETVQPEEEADIEQEELKTGQHEELEMVPEEEFEVEEDEDIEEFIHKGSLDDIDDEDIERRKRQSVKLVDFVIEEPIGEEEQVINTDDMKDEETSAEVSVEEEKGQEKGYVPVSEDEREAEIYDSASIHTKNRSSIHYDMGPRIRDIEDSQALDGNFLIDQDDIPLKFYKYMDEKDEEETQEESISEEEELSIDRVPYYEKHEFLTKQLTTEKTKNNILQKKIAKIFRRRKMDHVLKETNQQFDTQEKYGKKLDAYGELYNLDYIQRTTITNELDSLKSERESKFVELKKLFENLQTKEKDTGYGLIHSKTGNPIPDKLVEKLVNRQKNQMQTVGDMRLKHIQLKNMVLEKQNAITSLDKIGDNLYLMDYEQLKVENRSYIDKMEERDEELSRLRTKCQKTIQILAHMREKSAALESDIYDLSDEFQHHSHNSIAVRGNLNELKQQRDHYRMMTNKLRNESGLLTQNDLLRDMEYSVAELKSLSEKLELLKEEHKIKAQQIRNIRKNIELTPQALMKRSQKNIKSRSSHERHLYKGRPSLHKAVLPDEAFKHLRNYRGKPTYDKYEKKSRKKPIYMC